MRAQSVNDKLQWQAICVHHLLHREVDEERLGRRECDKLRKLVHKLYQPLQVSFYIL